MNAALMVYTYIDANFSREGLTMLRFNVTSAAVDVVLRPPRLRDSQLICFDASLD